MRRLTANEEPGVPKPKQPQGPLGTRIREARGDTSQVTVGRRMANKLGRDEPDHTVQSWVSRYESGDREPKTDELLALAEILDVDPLELLLLGVCERLDIGPAELLEVIESSGQDAGAWLRRWT